MGPFVVRDLLGKLRENPDRLEVLGTGSQVREFTYVSDAVEGLLLLAERGRPGETYNLSSGEPITILGLAQLLASALGLDGRTEIVCTGESWPGDAHRWEVSIDKMAALGFHPEITLRDGLARMVNA
jgi:UDP-glucose 4-epimerase